MVKRVYGKGETRNVPLQDKRERRKRLTEVEMREAFKMLHNPERPIRWIADAYEPTG